MRRGAAGELAGSGRFGEDEPQRVLSTYMVECRVSILGSTITI